MHYYGSKPSSPEAGWADEPGYEGHEVWSMLGQLPFAAAMLPLPIAIVRSVLYVFSSI